MKTMLLKLLGSIDSMRDTISTKAWIVGFLLVSVGSLAAVGWQKYNTIQRELERSLIREDSLVAVVDTTRLVLEAYQDSMQVFQRRMVQAEIKIDSLDRILGVQTRARARLELRVDSLASLVFSTVTEAPEGLKMDFHEYTPPFDVDVAVTVPPMDTLTLIRPPATALINVKLDPIPLSVRLSCKPNVRGDFNEATVNIVAPMWASVGVSDVQQSVEVCNPDLNLFDDTHFYTKPKFLIPVTAVITLLLSKVF